VQDPTVVSGLMTAWAAFLFEKKQLNCGISLKQPIRSCQTNDSTANDSDFHAEMPICRLNEI
jgi:hypothetical protein